MQRVDDRRRLADRDVALLDRAPPDRVPGLLEPPDRTVVEQHDLPGRGQGLGGLAIGVHRALHLSHGLTSPVRRGRRAPRDFYAANAKLWLPVAVRGRFCLRLEPGSRCTEEVPGQPGPARAFRWSPRSEEDRCHGARTSPLASAAHDRRPRCPTSAASSRSRSHRPAPHRRPPPCRARTAPTSPPASKRSRAGWSARAIASPSCRRRPGAPRTDRLAAGRHGLWQPGHPARHRDRHLRGGRQLHQRVRKPRCHLSAPGRAGHLGLRPVAGPARAQATDPLRGRPQQQGRQQEQRRHALRGDPVCDGSAADREA